MGKWICHPGDNRETRLSPVFRRLFTVKDGLESATLRLTAHGVYEAEINGKRVTDQKFTPGLTSYYYRIQVQEYDVTALVTEGGNLLSVSIGDGWWRWNNNFGYTLALWGELTLTFADGSTKVVATDESFEVGTGPVVKTDLQMGETYDARIEPQGWQQAVVCVEHTEGELIDNQSVPVREKEHFPGKPMRDSSGSLVIDFGQNITGYVRMTLRNTTPGQVVHLKHGEGLDTGIVQGQLNLLDSHDVSRFLSLCGGDLRRLRLAEVFLFTMPGIPCVFYGDELGVNGASETEYRGPMPWNDPPRDLREFFRGLTALRREDELLELGSWRTLCAEERLYVYERRLGNRAVTVALNAGCQSVCLPPCLSDDGPRLSQGWSAGNLDPFGYAIWAEKLMV